MKKLQYSEFMKKKIKVWFSIVWFLVNFIESDYNDSALICNLIQESAHKSHVLTNLVCENNSPVLLPLFSGYLSLISAESGKPHRKHWQLRQILVYY